MSTLIPNVSWEDFKKIADSGKLGQLKSCEVEIDGYTFTAIIPKGDMYTKDNARTKADFLAQVSNIVGGFEPEELLISLYPTVKRWRNMNAVEREDYRTSKSRVKQEVSV